jgi:cytochrome c oxidase subunit 4
MDILLNIVVLFGLLSVGLAFIVLLPTVGQLVASVFATVVIEQLFSKFRNRESGTVLSTPQGAPQPKHEPADHHQPPPAFVYVSVYLGLLVLTVVTVGVSELGLPMKQAVFWAVIVASIKATLVIAWFMHVRGGPAINRFVLSTSVFFMAVFFTLTMADLSTRSWTAEEESHWTPIKEALRAGEAPAGWSTSDKDSSGKE